jgi:hypothetical protein
MKAFLLSTAASTLNYAGFDASTLNISLLAGAVVALTGVAILVYLLPAFIAEERKQQHRMPIFLLNLLLGWTFFGWVGALVWATMPISPPPLPVSAFAVADERKAA